MFRHIDPFVDFGKRLERSKIKPNPGIQLDLQISRGSEEGFVALVKTLSCRCDPAGGSISSRKNNQDLTVFDAIPLEETTKSDFLAEPRRKELNKFKIRVSEMLAGMVYSGNTYPFPQQVHRTPKSLPFWKHRMMW